MLVRASVAMERVAKVPIGGVQNPKHWCALPRTFYGLILGVDSTANQCQQIRHELSTVGDRSIAKRPRHTWLLRTGGKIRSEKAHVVSIL